METTQLHPCGYSQCDQPFEPNAHQRGQIARGHDIYCSEDHRRLGRIERQAIRNAERTYQKKHYGPPSQTDQPETPEPMPILPGFAPFGAHPNSILSFAL